MIFVFLETIRCEALDQGERDRDQGVNYLLERHSVINSLAQLITFTELVKVVRSLEFKHKQFLNSA